MAVTGPSAPDPTVETVARVLAKHEPQWHGEDPERLHLGCTGCDWRTINIDDDIGDEAIDVALAAAEAAHVTHQAEAIVAALREAAGTADVDDLAGVARQAFFHEPGDAYVGDWGDVHAEAKQAWRAVVRAVLDRLAVTGAEDPPVGAACPECGGTEPMEADVVHHWTCTLRPSGAQGTGWLPTPDAGSHPTPIEVGDDAVEPDAPWRVGTHYGIHVYTGDEPTATFHRAEDAATAVGAVNAALRAGGGS